MATQREADAMRLAIALSARGLGTTSPNPPVGCVILDPRGEVVGTGYHQRKGESHAETYALTAAGSRAAGGTAVVTLEPCNHVGRTPACRQALVDAGVARVVVALRDPTSRGEGGAAMLRTAGIDVEVGLLADEARLVLGPWLHALAIGRPYLKAASMIDDQGFRPLDARQLAELRVGVDAVLFANGTIEEGKPDSHGRGILTLPSQTLSGAPADQLAELYAGGVRLLLLVGDATFVGRFAVGGVVDRLLLYVARSEDATRQVALPGQCVPRGFQIAGLSVGEEYVIIECAPEAESSLQVRHPTVAPST